MKKTVLLLTGAALAIALTACTGNVTINNQNAADSKTVTEESADNDDAVQPEDSQPSDTQPAEETGPESLPFCRMYISLL